MREPDKVEKWVVYETIKGPKIGMRSVCTAGEWKSMESGYPGHHQVVKEGITDETEAEILARGTSGDAKLRQKSPPPTE